MPILVESFEWSQTKEQIFIIIPKAQRAKIIGEPLITKRYVKINFLPYFFECFLEHNIDSSKSVCKVLENFIQLILHKIENDQWMRLEVTSVGNLSREEKQKLREKAFKENEDRIRVEANERQEQKSHEKREAIERGMFWEQENVRKADEMEEKMKAISLSTRRNSIDAAPSARETRCDNTETFPPIRKSATISVELTERRFPTPKRESQNEAEREWCLKQSKTRNDILSDDFNEYETDPRWLIRKGNRFFATKNFAAAMTAFKAAEEFIPESAVLQLNKAIVLFKLQNFRESAICSSRAFDLCTPQVEANRTIRAKCLLLRGHCLEQLGLNEQVNGELIAAQQLDEMILEWKIDIE